jgi:hypothetical protein
VRWPPACKDVSPGAEERPPMLPSSAVKTVTENASLCVCSHELCVNLITHPNPRLYSRDHVIIHCYSDTASAELWHYVENRLCQR